MSDASKMLRISGPFFVLIGVCVMMKGFIEHG
jgi:hypothetical protein